jgi:adenylate kinase family enzyme
MLRKDVDMSQLIIIRGNSGSGKSTLAKPVQKELDEVNLLIPQDVARREMLAVKDGKGTPAIALIKELITYGAQNCDRVIVEGIFKKDWYREMFEEVISLFKEVFVYYYDIPFEETVRRHQFKPNCADFTAEDMKKWWNENDLLGIKGEKSITKEASLEESIEMICKDVNSD